MHRFFVAPEVLRERPVVLTGDQAHQVRRVLRLRIGDRVVLLDGRGAACDAALIFIDDRTARFEVERRWNAGGEPRIRIRLCQAVLKGERFEWALQKATEIGVAEFTPMICERSVVDDITAVEGKRERWERIIREAAEQSGRALLPVLGGAESFAETVESPANGALRLIPWEGEQTVRLTDVLAGCNLDAARGIEIFVGPEGGFTEPEIALARLRGLRTVTLGPRILRAETAGLVAASAILYHSGEF
jgi:16S rRNA (uracil1498-N3)-methyltransferase